MVGRSKTMKWNAVPSPSALEASSWLWWSQPCLLCPRQRMRKAFENFSSYIAHLPAWGAPSWGSSSDRFFLCFSLMEGDALLPQEESVMEACTPCDKALMGAGFDCSFNPEMQSGQASFMCRWLVGADGPHRNEDLHFMWLPLAIICERTPEEG